MGGKIMNGKAAGAEDCKAGGASQGGRKRIDRTMPARVRASHEMDISMLRDLMARVGRPWKDRGEDKRMENYLKRMGIRSIADLRRQSARERGFGFCETCRHLEKVSEGEPAWCALRGKAMNPLAAWINTCPEYKAGKEFWYSGGCWRLLEWRRAALFLMARRRLAREMAARVERARRLALPCGRAA